MGIPAEHLITCSFMAAPASLAVSKLFYPETEKSKTTIDDIKVEKGEESNVLDAAAKVSKFINYCQDLPSSSPSEPSCYLILLATSTSTTPK